MPKVEQVEEATDDLVRGVVADGWTALEQAARANLTSGDEVGFQLAVQRDGQTVVDLHGGRDGAAAAGPYPGSALQMTFSVSKGILALCIGLLVEQDLLDLAEPVAAYWPEFGRAGKGDIRVRDLLTHSAGLPAFERPMSVQDLSDWDLCVDQLARQRPVWPTNARRHGYHALTIGFLVGEVLRRASGKHPSEFLQDEIAGPLGLDLWFGVPATRLSEVVAHIPRSDVSDAAESVARRQRQAPGYLAATVSNPPINLATLDAPGVWQAEIPAISVVGDARSLAACYSIAVPGTLQRLSSGTLRALLGTEVWGDDEILVDQPTRFAGLFMRSSPREPMLSPASFGHNGYTGSLAFADPHFGVTFAYLGVKAEGRSTPHARITRLLAAIRDCL